MGIKTSRPIKEISKKATKDGYHKVSTIKSYHDSSKTFVSTDFSDRCTWFHESTRVVNEVAINTGDEQNYNFGSSNYVINLDKVTNREDYQDPAGIDCRIEVKVNDVIQSSGYTLNLPTTQNTQGGSIFFSQALQPSDVVKVTYSQSNGSGYSLVADSGKRILVDYAETQFSAGSVINDVLVFELSIDLGGGDIILGKSEYYSAKDFFNKGNNGTVLRAFGELAKDVNIFPWNYLTGFTIKPYGTPVDPTKNEFHKIKVRLKNDQPYTNCEIATGTFYCLIEDL